MRYIILLTVSLLTIFTTHLHATAQNEVSVFAEVDFSNDVISLSKDAVQHLNTLNLSENDGETVAKAIVAYQKANSEALGLELSLDRNGQLNLSSNALLEPNQISISSGLLEQYNSDFPGSLSSTLTEQEIEALLGERIFGVGGLTVGEAALLHQAGIHRTVHPILVQIVPLQLQRLRTTLCQDDALPCLIGRISVAYDALIATFNWQGQNNQKGPKELEACTNAFNAFIHVEDKAISLGTDQSWRDPSDPEHSNIAPFAKNFDTECLSPLSALGANETKITERMAVLRMPNAKTPFCSAFEVRTGVYLTAQHCFHNRFNGRVLDDRLKRGVIVEYGAPDTELAIDQSRLPSIQTRTGPQLSRVQRQIPGEEDVVLIFAANRTDQVNLDTFPSADPVIGSKLVVPGYFQFATLREPRVSRSSWAEQLRYTKRISQDYCRSYDVAKQSDESGCLIHRCQTIAGFSGSPIFQSDENGMLHLIGVHSGAQMETDHHCTAGFTLGGATGNSADPLVGNSNIGSLVNQARLRRLGLN